jgi:ArsR family metal-binding transcriptional regulator
VRNPPECCWKVTRKKYSGPNAILEWLKREINQAWEKMAEITPSTEGAPKPQVFEILKLLPRSNCRDCGEPTCMVFAAQTVEG